MILIDTEYPPLDINKRAHSPRELLKAFGLSPRKSLGQNFLTDDVTAQRIVRFANIQPGDVVIEVGPGIGALTRHLAQIAGVRHVFAIEIDRHLMPLLEQELPQADFSTLTLVQADALEVDYRALLQEHGLAADHPLRFVGNLPYYITSALIRRMLESGLNVHGIVLTVQREVAERIVAAPGDMSLLAVSVQFYGQPELLMRLDPSMFYPQPDVDSAVVRITPTPKAERVDAQRLFALAHAGFSQRRKQLHNTLAAGLGLAKDRIDPLLIRVGIDPTRRAETLSMDEWQALTVAYVAYLDTLKRSPKEASSAGSSSAEPAPSTPNTTEL
jgi:16S rRNA (adenine1518-N6/adenine1519-N6)-dimethyltransferase